MTSHPLDCPVRAALTSRHRAFAEADGGALRYHPGIVPFGAADAADFSGLARLVRPGEAVAFLEVATIATPAGFVELRRAEGVQMIAGPDNPPIEDPRIVALGRADAAEMLALAEATKPGPFTLRALDIGRFWGVRHDGRLVAMAGERMACDGFIEVSGVCSAPEARGQGLARLLSRHVAAVVAAEGARPFLHAFKTNAAAIGLYESIGFTLRAEVQLGVFQRV